MKNLDELRAQMMAAAQGATTLNVAFIGVATGLLEALAKGPLAAEALAGCAALDHGYVARWCDAAYAFGLVDDSAGAFGLTELGRAFLPSTPGTLMPFAVQSVLGAHMAERAAGLMRSGERPGERVLGERASILPWFGPMLAASFSGFFAREILPALGELTALGERGGLAVDLGCGNGWYLRALAARFPRLRGLGLDGFAENIRLASEAAEHAGLGERLSFRAGDIDDFRLAEPASLIAMNRALHHVWDRKGQVLPRLREALAPGGLLVVWEPRWPDERAALREPRRRAMAFQNLSEHVQGNHFLRPAEIEEAMREVGLVPRSYLFADGAEAVVVGTAAP